MVLQVEIEKEVPSYSSCDYILTLGTKKECSFIDARPEWFLESKKE